MNVNTIGQPTNCSVRYGVMLAWALCISLFVVASVTAAPAPEGRRRMRSMKKPDANANGEAGTTEAAEEEKKAPQNIYEMTLEQLREYQGFTYTSGGRDPMTFRLPVKKKDTSTVMKDPTTDGPITDTDEPKQITEEDKGKYLAAETVRLQTLMYSQEYDKIVTVAEEVRRRFLDEWGLPTSAENRQMWSEVLKMHKTAKRLRQLEETRREFDALTLKVTGIRWTPRGAAVLIENKIYEAGETITMGTSDVRVMIEVIEEDAVIFLYKGQRFRKVVEIASKK